MGSDPSELSSLQGGLKSHSESQHSRQCVLALYPTHLPKDTEHAQKLSSRGSPLEFPEGPPCEGGLLGFQATYCLPKGPLLKLVGPSRASGHLTVFSYALGQ